MSVVTTYVLLPTRNSSTAFLDVKLDLGTRYVAEVAHCTRFPTLQPSFFPMDSAGFHRSTGSLKSDGSCNGDRACECIDGGRVEPASEGITGEDMTAGYAIPSLPDNLIPLFAGEPITGDDSGDTPPSSRIVPLRTEALPTQKIESSRCVIHLFPM